MNRLVTLRIPSAGSDQMTTNHPMTAQLGDVIVAAFDEAAHYSADPAEVSRLATQMVLNLLRRAPRLPPSHSPAPEPRGRACR